MSTICTHCNKEFSSVSNLNTHLRNAVYCKRLQENPNYATDEKTCKGCNKLFDKKHNYDRHISLCKEFAVMEAINNTTQKFQDEIQKLHEELEKVNTILQEYKLNHRSSYKQKFNQLFINLRVSDPILIRANISNIRHQSLLTLGENDVNTNFMLYMSNAIKEFVFCTDISRNKIVIKREDGMIDRVTANNFIIECFGIARQELISLLRNAITYCNSQVNNLTHEDYTDSMNQLILLNTYINQPGINTIVKITSKLLVNSCRNLTNDIGDL